MNVSGVIFSPSRAKETKKQKKKNNKTTDLRLRDTRREKHCQILPIFFFVNGHNNTKTKPQAKKQRFLKLSQKFPEEKQQLLEE